MIGKKVWSITENNIKFDWIFGKNENYKEEYAEYIACNNVYFTEADCDKQIERNFALGRIMKFIRDNDIELVRAKDWGDYNIKKYYIEGWSYDCDKVMINWFRHIDNSQYNLAFYSQEDLDKVIKSCESDLRILLRK